MCEIGVVTTNGGHTPAESKPRFNLRPQEGCPTASKEKVIMAFLMILIEDAASISINKVQPVSCSQPPK